MYERLLRISDKSQGSGVKGLGSKRPRARWTFLIMTSLLFIFLASCTAKHVEVPTYEGVGLEDYLTKLKQIKTIEAVAAVEYEKNDAVMSGDAAIAITDKNLSVRVYYLGFLAGEVSEENGVVKSKPKLNRSKGIMFVDGLRSGFFWWNIENYTVNEQEDRYLLKNATRKLVLDKKTLLPIEQTLALENGEELFIRYEEPVKNVKEGKEQATPDEPQWYQSRMQVEYKNSLVKVKVKSYAAKL